MPVYKVTIAWGKQTFDNVELNTDEPPEVFKAQLFGLTMVPPERQKVTMPRAGLLKDTDEWSKYKGLKDGMKIMLIGTPDENLLKKPETTKVFVEDLPDNEQSAAASSYPPGLVNLGNTCYMNSTIQALRHLPELRRAASKYAARGGGDQDAMVASAFRDLLTEMSASGQPISPVMFLLTFRRVFPQFAQQGEGGGYMQQDAEECFSQLLKCLKKYPGVIEGGSNVVSQLFEGEMRSTVSCVESEAVEPTIQEEEFTRMACHIDNDVNHIQDSIRNSLIERYSKHTDVLEREAFFERRSQISKLPYYLNVQFVRFWWNQKAQVKAKITRPVDFPMRLDIFSFCTPELQDRLKPARLQMLEDSHASKAKARQVPGGPQPMDVEVAEDKMEDLPYENNTGYYDLVAVITHKGRDADSGHYVAWVKESEKTWMLYDDDVVTAVPSEEIRKLVGSGGADWHIAYLCIYQSVRYRVKANDEASGSGSGSADAGASSSSSSS